MSATPGALDAHEARLIEARLEFLSKEPAFADIVRVFRSRLARKLPLEPVQAALLNEVWRLIVRDLSV